MAFLCHKETWCPVGQASGFVVTAYICTNHGGGSREGPEGTGRGTAPRSPAPAFAGPRAAPLPPTTTSTRSEPVARRQRQRPASPALFTHARASAAAPPCRPYRHCKERPVAHAHSAEAAVRGGWGVLHPRPVPKALGCFRSFPAPRPFPAPSPLAWAPQSRRRGGRRRKMAVGIGGEAAAGAAAAAVMQTTPSAASARAGVARG